MFISQGCSRTFALKPVPYFRINHNHQIDSGRSWLESFRKRRVPMSYPRPLFRSPTTPARATAESRSGRCTTNICADRSGYTLVHRQADPSWPGRVLDRCRIDHSHGCLVAATATAAFRDANPADRPAGRHADAYEDRIAELRARVDRATSRAARQEQYDQKLNQIMRRRQQLKSRNRFGAMRMSA